MSEQIRTTTKTARVLLPQEAVYVARAVEVYLKGQLQELYKHRAKDYCVGHTMIADVGLRK